MNIYIIIGGAFLLLAGLVVYAILAAGGRADEIQQQIYEEQIRKNESESRTGVQPADD